MISNPLARWLGLALLGAADTTIVATTTHVIPAVDHDGRTAAVVVGLIVLLLLAFVGLLADTD